MTKSAQEIAEEVLPGWRAERSSRSDRRVPEATRGTPDIDALRRKYLGEAAGADTVGLAPASGFSDDDTEYVVLRPAEGGGAGRRVVVVSHGRAIAIQG